MSATIDERVVEMRFDNKQFESGVKESLSTLDKLKQALNLSDSAKGLENIQKAAEGVKLDGIGTAVEGVKEKFSAFEAIALGALIRIGEKAIDTGAQLIKSLSIDQISAGFGEYELKMGSVQTILASTGESLDTVNKYLEELNTYSDQTIYSFSDMTNSIGKFTNAGVGLEDAVMAIKGISNEAAVSGANANEASRAMYNFAQALSAGYVKLIDWKSIENANMATVEFKTQLLESAVAAGTLEKTADGMYRVLTTNAQGATMDDVISATKNFNDSLSYQWMTTETLVGTLKNYADETTEIGAKAKAAATEVKTFSMLMDTLKEAVGSGWAQTFELIFGDFNEAKELWTGVSNTLGDIISQSADARNSLLAGALDKVNLVPVLSDVTGMTEESIKKLAELGKETGTTSAEFQDFADVLAEGDDDVKNYLTHAVEMANSGKNLTTYISDLTGMTEESVNELIKLGKETGYTSKEFEDLASSLAEGDESMQKLITNLVKGDFKNGRATLIDSIRNSFEGLQKIVGTLKGAWKEIFPPATSDQLYDLITAIHNFSEKLIISDETADKLGRTFKGVFAVLDIVKQAFSALFDLISPGTSMIGGFAGGILDLTANLGDWLVALDESVKKNEAFGKAVSKIQEIIKAAKERIDEFVKVIKDFVSTHFKAPDLSFITDVADTAEKRFKPLQSIFDFFSKAVTAVVNALSKAAPIIGTVASVIGKALSSLGSAIAGAFTGGGFNAVLDLFNGGVLATIGIGISKFINNLSSITKEGSGLLAGITELKDAILDTFGAIQSQIKSKTLMNIAIAIAVLTASLVALSMIDSNKLGSSLGVVTVLFGELFGTMAAFEKIMGGSKLNSISSVAKSMIVLSAAVLVLASAMKKISGIDSDKLLGSLGSVSLLLGEMSAVAIILSKYGGKVKTGAVSIIAFAGAIYILTASVEKLGELDVNTLIKGLTSVGVLLAELAAFMVAAKFGSLKLTQAAGIAVLAGALLILQGAVSDFGNMDTTQIVKGLAALGGIMAELAVFSLAAGHADHILATSVAMIGLAAAMKILEDPMTTFGNMSLTQIGKGLLAMGGALAEVAIAMKLMPKNSMTVGLGLIEAAAGITIISNALDSFADMTWEEIARGLVAMGVSLAELAIAMNAMKGTLSGSAAMLVMSAALLTFVPVLKSLGGMEWDEIAKGLVALGGAFLVVGVAGAVLGPLVPSILGLAGALALLGVAVAGIGVGLLAGAAGLTALAAAGVASAATIVAMLEIIVVGLLNTIRDSASALGEALTTVILALCDVIVKCVPEIVDTVLVVVSQVLASLAENAPNIVHSLLQLIIGIIDSLAADMPTVIQSVVNLFMSFFAGVSQALQGIDVSVLIEGIVGIGLLSALMLALAAMASLAPSAMVGVLAMGAVIAELALVLAAIGALAQIPGLEWLIGEGGTLLQGIGTAIGKFVGGIVGGFMEGVSAQFPQIGTDLSNFMTNVQPFLDGASKIDPGMLEGVQALAKTILLLTAADILQGLTSWLTGGSSLASFGEELAAFGPPFAQFAEDIKDVDPAVVTGAANAAMALAEMASNLPNSGGLAGKIFGENNLSEFGEELEKFGPHLAQYGEDVKNVNPEVVEASARAAQVLADMASTLPNSGGLAAKILGDNTLSAFGEELEKFGPHLGAYGNSVKDVNPEVVEASARAAQVMADMASTLPNSGGLAAKIMGDNTLSSFGEELSKFGPYIADYASSVAGMDADVVVSSANAALALSELANGLPNSGGLLSWFTGDNDIATFGESLSKFGNSMSAYYQSVSGIDTALLDSVILEVSKLIDIATGTASIDTSGMTGFANSLQTMGNNGIEAFIQAFNGSVSNVTAAVNGMMTAAGNAIVTGGTILNTSATTAGGNAALALGTAITSKQGTVTSAVSTLCAGVINALRSGLPTGTFSTIGQNTITYFINGINAKKSLTLTTVRNLCTSFIQQMKTSLPSTTFTTIGQNTVQSFINGINAKKPLALTTVRNLCTSIVTEFKTGLPSQTFSNIGGNLVTALAQGITNKKGSATEAAKQVCQAVVQAFRDNLTSDTLRGIGENAATGLGNGIRNKINDIKDAAISAAREAIQAAKEALDVNSPSRVFTEIGEYVSVGMANGILNKISAISAASLDLTNSAVDPVQAAISTINNLIENGLSDDFNPTITPVLNLSNVEKGAQRVSSMFRGLDVSGTYRNALSAGSSFGAREKGTEDQVTEGEKGSTVNHWNLTQNNYSPKALSRADIYRQTRNQFATLKEAVEAQ